MQECERERKKRELEHKKKKIRLIINLNNITLIKLANVNFLGQLVINFEKHYLLLKF